MQVKARSASRTIALWASAIYLGTQASKALKAGVLNMDTIVLKQRQYTDSLLSFSRHRSHGYDMAVWLYFRTLMCTYTPMFIDDAPVDLELP